MNLHVYWPESKTLEKCVVFAKFCKTHDVNPVDVAEAIETFKRAAQPGRSWDKKQELRNHAIAVLVKMGFENIEFGHGKEYYDPTFEKNGIVTTLPRV